MRRVLVAVVGCLVLAGCTDEPEPVSLPPVSPSETATTTDTTPTTSATPTPDANEEAAVRRVYVASAKAYHVAQGMPAHQQRAYLERYEVDPLLGQDLATLAQSRKEHYRLVGRPALHIIDITVDGDTATVEDCIDHSAEYWKDSRTGRAITGSRQPAGVWSFTTVTRTADGWRTSDASAKRKRCKAG